MGNLFVNGNRAIGFGGRTTGGTGTQRSAFRVRLNLPPVQGGGPDPQDVVAWRAGMEDRINSWLQLQSTKPATGSDKWVGQRCLARLRVNPTDSTVYAHLANTAVGGYMVKSDGTIDKSDEFSRAIVGWILAKYWNNFTSGQRDSLLGKLKQHWRNNDHSTENHALMNAVGSYLLAQAWPSESGWVLDVNTQTGVVSSTQTSAQMFATAKANLLSVAKSLYAKGYHEDNSTNYGPTHLHPWHCLYNGATDPDVRAMAKAAIDFHMVNLAARHIGGTTVAPYARNNRWEANVDRASNNGNLHFIYWGDIGNRLTRDDNSIDDFTTTAAISEWRPSDAILSLGRGETAPYVLTVSRPRFGFWGAYNGGASNNTGIPDDRLGYFYVDKLFAVGSSVYQYEKTGGYLDDAGFSIAYRSGDMYSHVEAFHEYWRSNDTNRVFQGTNSLFTQTAQYKGAAVMLVNIPNADPWANIGRSDWVALRDLYNDNLRKQLFLRYPNTVTSMFESSGWIFLEEVGPQGSIYIAIYLGQPYTIGAAGVGFGNVQNGNTANWRLVTSTGAKNVAIFDVSTSEQFASFAAFRTAVLANSRTVNLTDVSATYTSVNGATINASWTATDYNPANITQQGLWVRPTVTITTETAQTITDPFPAARGGAAGNLMGRPVLSAPFINMQNGTSLTLTTPRGTHSVVWNGDLPTITVT